MPIFYPPPPPFVGGRQPYAPRVNIAPAISSTGDDPPFAGPRRLTNAFTAVLAAQPNPWVYNFIGLQPYGTIRLQTSAQIDNPPTNYGGPIANPASIIAQAPNTNPWSYGFVGFQPYGKTNLPPGVLSVTIDNPPFTYGGPITLQAEIIGLNQPSAWPYMFLGPLETSSFIPINEPPYTHQARTPWYASTVSMLQPNPWVYNFIGGQPYGKNNLIPSIISVQIDNPPFTYGGPVALRAEITGLNQPDPWVFTILGPAAGTQPYTPKKLYPDALISLINDPPFKYGGPVAVTASILGQAITSNPWTYAYAGSRQPYDKSHLPPSLIDAVINNPPFSSRRDLSIIDQWGVPYQQLQPRRVYKVTVSLGYSKGYIIQ